MVKMVMFGEKKEEYTRVFIRVDDDTLGKVDETIEEEGWSKSGIVEEAVKKCLQILKE